MVMIGTTSPTLIDLVQEAAHPLTGGEADYDPLIGLIGDARFVLLGEASHGTHEFYGERARITRRLIQERGFTAVAVEADWPDAYRVNTYVRGESPAAGPEEALRGFRRFPAWMWRNRDVVDFIQWLRAHNDALPPGARRAGFYGLDLYSFYASIEAVLAYLDRVDPEAARRARGCYACFDHYGEDSQAYGDVARFNLPRSCQEEAIQQVVELQRKSAESQSRDGRLPEDAFFYAEQTARVVRNAEAYYRAMFRRRVSSWNLRDRQMAQTLDALIAHLDRQGEPAKVIVWAHNSHLGDARATQMGETGELNLGQLVRERYGRDAVLIGFTTYSGSVTAASDWGGPAERKRVRPALPESYESLFHNTGIPRLLIRLRDAARVASALRDPRLERAIGVIYRPETERLSHYFHARLSDQFDAVLHFDHTHAVEPLERTSEWEAGGETPETFPTGI